MKRNKLRIGIRNEITSGNTLELYFLDGIYDYIDWTEFTIVNLVQDVIDRVNSTKPSLIVCFINSEGGACDIGLALYAYLKYQSNAEVETRTLALAGSIASILVQAASKGKRYMAKSAQMVIHEAWGSGAYGTATDMRNAADMLDGYTDVICEIYADASGRPATEFRDLIAGKDYWMNATKAIELGLADDTFNNLIEGFSIQNSIRGLDEHYVNIPDQFKPFINPSTSPTMTIKERVQALLGKTNAITIDPKTTNVAEAISNALTPIFNEFATDLDADIAEAVNAALTAKETDVTTQITTAVNTAKTEIDTVINAMKTDNGTMNTRITELQTQNTNLLNELASLKGKPASAGAANDEVKPIGSFVKAQVPATA